MGDELEIEVLPEEDESDQLYPWAQDDAERRRAFVFEFYRDPEIEVGILLKNMDLIERWLKSGELPKVEGKSLRAVK